MRRRRKAPTGSGGWVRTLWLDRIRDVAARIPAGVSLLCSCVILACFNCYETGLAIAQVVTPAAIERDTRKDIVRGIYDVIPPPRPVTDEMLRNPPAADWLGYRANYASWGYSALRDINRHNVARMSLAWVAPMAAGPNEATPIAHDGVLFVPNPNDVIEALDGRYGARLWLYRRVLPADIAQPNAAGGKLPASLFPIKRNIAIYQDKVYTITADQYVAALNARDGRLEWQTEVGDYHQMVSTSGPMVADGKVITTRSCDPSYPGGCFVTAHDASNGKEVWRRRLIPAPGEPGDETWMGLPLDKRVHVGAWGVPSYDPTLGLLYVGTSVPAPSPEVLRGTSGGDVLYSNSTLALDVKTGAIAWYFQHLPRDNWDQDHVFERLLVDAPFDPDPQAVMAENPQVRRGQMRQVLTGVPGKTGLVWTLDRKTGQFLWARTTVPQNLITSVDPVSGRPTINEALILKSATARYPLVCPADTGGKNWPASAYSPRSAALYVPLLDSCVQIDVTTTSPKPADLYALGWRHQTPDPAKTGWLEAISIETGRTLWRHEQRGRLFGVLATAGDLIFAGDSAGRFMAFDALTGAVLWATQLHASVSGTPISYAIDGEQYIAVAVGGGDWLSDYANELSELRVRRGGNMLYVFRLGSRQVKLNPLDIERSAQSAGESALTASLKTNIAMGARAYKTQCAGCHGDAMEGSGHVPALIGCAFYARWGEKPIEDFYSRINLTMPPGAASPLDAATTANLVAYWGDTQGAPSSLTRTAGYWSAMKMKAFGSGCSNERP
jgi:PQQ-dependent dehydrogenase (methanol/ethanol family)